MDPYRVNGEHRATVEVIKDKNGIDQILLQNSRGASLMVRN